MPRPDGKPTIREILDAAGEGPVPFKLDQPVRYCEGTTWVYGVILAAVDPPADADWGDDGGVYRVRNADGTEIQLDAGSLRATDGPRDNPWPMEEDCTHCPGQAGPDGQHKFGCALWGARQVRLSAVLTAEGKVRIVR